MFVRGKDFASFAKGRDSDGEPIRGYMLTVVVAAAGIFIGDLNVSTDS